MMKMRWKRVNFMGAVAALALSGAVAVAPTSALAQCQGDDSGPSQTLDTRVAQTLQTVFEQMQAEQYRAALTALDGLIAQRGSDMKPFDRATTYELRGSVKASLEDYRGAQRDFQVALDTNALPAARNNQLRYFVAQLNFQIEDYRGAIDGLNGWIRTARQCGDPIDSNAFYLLAAAYTQVSPPNYRAAVPHAEAAKNGAPEPRKSYYDLLNLVYSETGEQTKRQGLLEEMVNLWPGNKGYWTQLSGSYSTAKKDQDAFSVLEVAYRAGLLSTESELLTLIQYYSFFDNPFRGAKMLEREMDAGNIQRSQKNLILLSQLWSQAREHKKSIPVLRAAAQGSDSGTLYYRLGQVLLADEQYTASETALNRAVSRGGMSRKDTGDAWLLLGTARFNQAGPEDVAIWSRAQAAFRNALRYENVSRRAADWISYIDAVRTTYDAQKALERQQALELCQDNLERLDQEKRIRELRNEQPTQADIDREAALLAECGPEALAEKAAEQAAEDAAIAEADAAANAEASPGGNAGDGVNASEETPSEEGATEEAANEENDATE